MKTRRPHFKSRRGCLTCKRRHVKCDEQGPPCAGCVTRQTECAYPPPSAFSNHVEGSMAILYPVSSDAEISSSEEWAASTAGAIIPSPQSLLSLPSPIPLNPSPAAFSICQSSNRLLELELMHRWTRKTWAALHFIPGEQPFLQDELPYLALGNSFVLDGLMALAALDLAINSCKGETSITNVYLRTAIRHMNRASAEFRHQLSFVNRENIHLLYYFSTMAALFNCAAPTLPVSPLQHIDTAIAMILGAVSVAQTNFQWLYEGATAIAAYMQNCEVRLELLESLEAGTLAATTRISAVIHTAYLPGGSLAADNILYKMAADQLKYAFAEGTPGLLHGNWLSFIAFVGHGFAKAVHAREHVALFLLMHHAVLVHRASLVSPEQGWWLGLIGRELVAEISELLSTSPLVMLDDVRDAIAWTRLQTGLPPMQIIPSVVLTQETSQRST